MNLRVTLFGIWLVTAFDAGAVDRSSDKLPPLSPKSEEMHSALEAAPLHLRAGAGVYVLEKSGYRRVRDSTNGFNCLITREIASTFEPQCFDSEGSATLLPVIIFRAEQRALGRRRADIDLEVAARYARGEFFPPRRVGICYMLSPNNVVVLDHATDKVWHVGPRLMFYAPNVNSQDFGVTPDLEARFLVAREAGQSTMIIVPVTTAQRTRINYFSPDNQSPLAKSPNTASSDPVPVDSLKR